MRNLFYVAALALLVSCTPKGSDNTASPEERAIGFNTMLPDLKFHLGTEEAIQVVKDLDKAWTAGDWEAMKTFFADTATCYFPDGTVANGPDEFVDIVKKQFEGADISWTFDYAYSVDLDPTRGGEHVQAGFTGTGVKDGVTSKSHYHEWYYVVDGKIVMWRQFESKINNEEEES